MSAEQMIQYAYQHKNFRKYMQQAYMMVGNWYWMKYSEFIEVDIEVYKDASKEKNRIYTKIVNLCMSCVIDNAMPTEEQISNILENEYTPTPLPF